MKAKGNADADSRIFIRLDCHFTVFVDQTFAIPLYVMPPHGVPESKLVYVDDGATALVIVRLEDQLGYASVCEQREDKTWEETAAILDVWFINLGQTSAPVMQNNKKNGAPFWRLVLQPLALRCALRCCVAVVANSSDVAL